jgi:hypothetical protein
MRKTDDTTVLFHYSTFTIHYFPFPLLNPDTLTPFLTP